MQTTTLSSTDVQAPELVEGRASQLVERLTSATQRVSPDLAIGLTLLGVVIAGRLLWAIADGGLLAALGAR